MPREAAQERGRVGAATAKRWLEATTFVTFPWNSYRHESRCEVLCLDGTVKVLDLSGYFLVSGRPVFVEVKNVTSDSHLREQFNEFLAVAYSSTRNRAKSGRPDDEREFMWVSWHPFGPMSKWSSLASVDAIEEALSDYPDLLDGENFDRDLARVVADRVWVLTFNPKQERLTMPPEEVVKVNGVLMRAGAGL